MRRESEKRPAERDINFSRDASRNPLTAAQQEVYAKHALLDESFPGMLVRIRSRHTRREMTELIGQGQKRLKRWFSQFEIKAALSDEEKERRAKEAGRKRTIRHIEQVVGENYVEKINYMLNDLNLPYRQIAREFGVCNAELRYILRLLDIDKIPRETKENEQTESIPDQNEFKQPEINTQNLPIIDAVNKALEQGLLDKRRAAILLWLNPYKGESPSLSTVGNVFGGVSRQAIQQSRETALKTLKKSGLL